MSVANQDPQVVPTVGAKKFLTQMVAALQHLALCTVHLYTNNYQPEAGTVLADLHEPDTATEWAEYAPIATTSWGAQAVDITGRVYVTANPLLVWVGPAIPFDQTVYGYFLRSAQAGLPLLTVNPFATPVPMQDDTHVLNAVATFTYPNQQ